MVESEKLLKLINSTEELSWEDIAWLELKSKQYPYFQSIRVIIAKHYLKENHVLKSHKIHTASTYAIDRNILRKRLTEKVSIKVIPIESIALEEDVKISEHKSEAINSQKTIEEPKEVTTVSTTPSIVIEKQDSTIPQTSSKDKSREELLKAVHDRLAELQKNKAGLIEEKTDSGKDKIETPEISQENIIPIENKINETTSIKEDVLDIDDNQTTAIVNVLEVTKDIIRLDSSIDKAEPTKEETSNTPIIESETIETETIEETQIVSHTTEAELKAKKEERETKRKLKLAETKRKKEAQKIKDEQIKSDIEEQSKPDKLFYSRLGNELNVENSDSIDLLLNYLESQKEKKKIVEEISYAEIKETQVKVEKSTESIIEKFIQNDPRISKPDPKAKAPSEDLSESKYSKTKFVSENLAKIKAKQGYLKEAKEIYQELILKNPEKSSYFTEQINKLK